MSELDKPFLDVGPERSDRVSPENPDALIINEIVDSVMAGVERVNVDTENARHKIEEAIYQRRNSDDQDAISPVPPFVTREKERPPHTVTGLVVMVAILVRIAFFNNPRDSFERDIRVSLASSAAVFLFYCTLQLQDGEVTRPHPVLWRLIHGIIIIYLIFIVFLLSLSSPAAVDRTMQVLLDPSCGTAPLPRFETSDYTADCSVSPGNLWNKIWDLYFFAHFFGWIVKALILRDWGLMWTCSLIFEVMEISLQKALPNFQECWWDRWLLDIFGCNLAGMYVGMKIAGWIGAKEYDWSGMAIMTKKRKLLQRVLRLATPKVFPRKFEWHAFSSWKRFGVSLLVVLIILFGDINGFLLKSSLQVPQASSLIVLRVIFITPAGYASVVELYAFAEDRTNRIGRIAWISVSITLLELLLAFKNFSLRDSFRPDQYNLDDQVQMCWIASIVLSLLLAALKLGTRGRVSQATTRYLGRLTMLPFAYMLLWDAWQYGGMKEIVNHA